MGKKEKGSKLLKALGKTKKEQMAKLYPKVKGDIRGKGPYLRGKVMGTGDFESRRRIMAGTGEAHKALRKVDKAAVRDTAVIGAAALAGFGVGKYDSSKKSKAKTHQEKARRGAKELIKKQKAKKEKHHSR